MNGKGEINNVELNCSHLNEQLVEMTPYLELERVHVSKLSFHVTSWTNLRRAPIVIDLQHVTARAVEPLHFNEKSKSRQFRQLTREDLAEMIVKGLLPPKRTNPYNLFDRILDNLTVEITSLRFEYQPTGKFKTRRPGPWTPPELQLELKHLQLVSVNEYGQEASPDEIWRNHHHRDSAVMIYKRLSMQYRLLLKPLDGDPVPLVTGRDNQLQIQIALQRRVKDGEFSAVQLDTTLPTVEIDVSDKVLPLLAETLAAIAFCLAKDRAFVDPLKSEEHVDQHFDLQSSAEANTRQQPEGFIHPEEFPADSSSSSSEDEQEEAKNDHLLEIDTPLNKMTPQGQHVLLMPNGMIVYEKFSLSLSILNTTLRGTYNDGGHMETVVKGCVVELIWPQADQRKGGYIQASLSYISIHEMYGNRHRCLLMGGVQYNEKGQGLEDPATPLSEVGRDETFPLYEQRSVRPDPTGLRHTFPAQAIGVKTTIEYLENGEVRFVNEVGMDQLELVADMHAWKRILYFACHVEEGGFDPRWYSGDWGRSLKRNMLLRPNEPLLLEECLQPSKQIFLDENCFISSDLFNLTARLTNVHTKVPADLSEDLRSCDVLLYLDEAMLVVSSALPRTFLSGRIGSSTNGDKTNRNEVIVFPNDETDVVYQLENSEDPSNRQRGIRTSRPISTFRMQLTLRGYSIRLEPIIPCGKATDPQQLISPSEMTLLFCFEGEPPQSSEENLTKMALFLSALFHRLDINMDLDLLSSAAGTLSYHAVAAISMLSFLSDSFQSAEVEDPSESTECTGSSDAVLDGRIRSSLRGRRALVKRQLYRSRETGGCSLALALQVAESSFCLWRQNVPEKSQLRTESGRNRSLSLVRICSLEMVGVEAGVETSFQKAERRLVVKMCLSSFALTGMNDNPDCEARVGNTSVFSLKSRKEIQISDPFDGDAVFLRFEEVIDKKRNLGVSIQISGGEISCHRVQIEETIILALEALLMPTNANNFLFEVSSSLFPRGSVGAHLHSFIPTVSTGSLDLQEEMKSLLSKMRDLMIGKQSLREIIQSFARRIRPDDVDIFLFSATARDITTHFFGADGGFASLLQEVDLIASYLSHEFQDCPLYNVAGRTGKRWSSVLLCNDIGVWHGFQCEQSLVLLDQPSKGENCMMWKKTPVIQKFRSGYVYEKANLTMSLLDGPLIQNMERLDSFVIRVLGFINGWKHSFLKLSSILASLRVSSPESGMNHKSRISGGSQTPIALACDSTGLLLQSVSDLVTEIRDHFVAQSSRQQQILDEKQREIDGLKILVFSKERSRLAALALVSSEISSWVRMGSAQRSGQRGLHSCALWPQWLVLRRSVLLIYNAPGLVSTAQYLATACICTGIPYSFIFLILLTSQYDPVSIIPLAGASLKELCGGRRKRDIKRAFGLVDSAGTTYFLVASSDQEYDVWIRKIHFSTKAASTFTQGGDSQGEEYKDRENGDIIESQDTIDDRNEDEGLSTEDSQAGIDIRREEDNRQKPLRSRFAGVGQATKTRFGTAFQAARQKGKDFTERTRKQRGSAVSGSWSMDSSETTSVASTGVHNALSTDTNAGENNGGVSCRTCTFINSDGAETCEICNSPLDVVSAVAVVEEGNEAHPNTPSSKKDDIQGGTGVRAGMRERLGAAVRNVRKGASVSEDESSVVSNESRKARSIFRPRTFQGQQDSDNLTIVGPDAINLRHISMGRPLLPKMGLSDAPEDAVAVPLKRIHGNWRVQVVAVVDKLNVTAPEDSNQESITCTPGTLEPERGLLFTIKVSRQNAMPNNTEVLSEFQTNGPNVLALHTAISECISCLPSSPYYNIDSSRTSAGDMGDGLASTLGLNAVETVRVTGKLLGGLVKRGLSDVPSNQHTFACKYGENTKPSFWWRYYFSFLLLTLSLCL